MSSLPSLCAAGTGQVRREVGWRGRLNLGKRPGEAAVEHLEFEAGDVQVVRRQWPEMPYLRTVIRSTPRLMRPCVHASAAVAHP
jgi:hypothetical protein